MIIIRCSRYHKCSWAKLTKRFEKCLWLVEARYPDGSTNQLRSDTLRHQLMEFLSCSFLIRHFAVKLVVAECFLMQPPELYQHTLCKWFSVYPCQKILLDIVTIFRECKHNISTAKWRMGRFCGKGLHLHSAAMLRRLNQMSGAEFAEKVSLWSFESLKNVNYIHIWTPVTSYILPINSFLADVHLTLKDAEGLVPAVVPTAYSLICPAVYETGISLKQKLSSCSG